MIKLSLLTYHWTDSWWVYIRKTNDVSCVMFFMLCSLCHDAQWGVSLSYRSQRSSSCLWYVNTVCVFFNLLYFLSFLAMASRYLQQISFLFWILENDGHDPAHHQDDLSRNQHDLPGGLQYLDRNEPTASASQVDLNRNQCNFDRMKNQSQRRKQRFHTGVWSIQTQQFVSLAGWSQDDLV